MAKIFPNDGGLNVDVTAKEGVAGVFVINGEEYEQKRKRRDQGACSVENSSYGLNFV